MTSQTNTETTDTKKWGHFYCGALAGYSAAVLLGPALTLGDNLLDKVLDRPSQPKSVFNIVSEDCSARSVQQQIKLIETNGFKARCSAPPAP